MRSSGSRKKETSFQTCCSQIKSSFINPQSSSVHSVMFQKRKVACGTSSGRHMTPSLLSMFPTGSLDFRKSSSMCEGRMFQITPESCYVWSLMMRTRGGMTQIVSWGPALQEHDPWGEMAMWPGQGGAPQSLPKAPTKLGCLHVPSHNWYSATFLRNKLKNISCLGFPASKFVDSQENIFVASFYSGSQVVYPSVSIL